VSGIFAALLVGTTVSIIFALRAAENARVADENARLAIDRERTATYESYRARIAAAVAALSQHDVADAANQLDAAPEHLRDWEWRHLRIRLDDSTFVIPSQTGASQFLIHDRKGSRIATWTPTGLRLNDLDGNELLSRSFPTESNSIFFPPLPTKHGLRLVERAGERAARDQALAHPSDTTANIVHLLDDEGRMQTQLKCPPGTGVYLVAVSPDGSRLAVCWANPMRWAFTVYDADSGRQTATSDRAIGFTWDLVFSPDGARIATACEDGRIRLWVLPPAL
jgi:WD40 repeat protein